MMKRAAGARQKPMDSYERNQRTARGARTARGRRKQGAALCIARGVLVSVALCAVLVAAFAWALSMIDLSEGAVTAINQCIKFISILAGVYACVGRGGEKGALRGACVGALYMALGVALYALLSAQQLGASAYLADLGMGVASGGLFGMILSNLAAK